MRRCTIRLAEPDTAITVDIPMAEWDQLKAYSAYCEQLRCTRLMASGQRATMSLKIDAARGSLDDDSELPADDDVSAFLHRMRPFVHQQERTSFEKVCSVLGRRLDDVGLRSFLKQQRDIFSGKEFADFLRLECNTVLINSDGTLRDWLFGFEYHKDESKQAAIYALDRLFPKNASRVVFVNMMLNKAQAVLAIDALIGEMSNSPAAT